MKTSNQFFSIVNCCYFSSIRKNRFQLFKNRLKLILVVSLIYNHCIAQEKNIGYCGGLILEDPAMKGAMEFNIIDKNFIPEGSTQFGSIDNNPTCNSAGFFSLNYTGGGFTDSEMQTICEVFNYLSSIIANPNNVIIRIEINNYNFLNSDDTPNTNTLGDAAPFYDFPDCGLTPNRIWKKLYGDWNNSGMDGRIRLNANMVWHTTDMDFSACTPPIPSNPIVCPDLYDLYSVVLHESLHLIAFASLIDIGNNNTPVGFGYPGIFSYWDANLYGTPPGEYLIHPSTGEKTCCDEYEYNVEDFSDFPNDISGGCLGNAGFPNIYYDETLIAPVSSNSLSASSLPNYLSHLDENCAGITQPDYYVMHASLGKGVPKRIISAAEMAILTDLGYVLPSSDCYLDGEHDSFQFTIEVGSTIEVFFSDLLANDIYNGDIEVTLNEEFTALNLNLGISYTIEITPISFLITALEYFSPPIYANGAQIYYTITGCNGEVCDDGSFHIQILPKFPDIPNCPLDCKNLVCNGDFESFIAASASYYVQANLDQMVLNGYTPIGASPNIEIGDNGGKHIYVQNGNALYVLLNSPIMPGCNANIEFSASGYQPSSTLDIFGSETQPCLIAQNPNGCNSNGINLCSTQGNLVMNCIMVNQSISYGFSGQYNILYHPNIPESVNNVIPYPYSDDYGWVFYRTGIEWTNYQYNWVNNTSVPVNYLYFFPRNNPFLLDNIVVTNMCSELDPGFNSEPSCNKTICFQSDDQDQNLTHFWEFGDAEALSPTSDQINPCFTFSGGGVYTVTHTVQNALCDVSSYSEEITVFPGPEFEIIEVECGEIYFFDGESGNVLHEWKVVDALGGLVCSGSEEDLECAFMEEGTFTITHTIISDQCGLQNFSTPLEIAECTPPINCDSFYLRTYCTMCGCGEPIGMVSLYNSGVLVDPGLVTLSWYRDGVYFTQGLNPVSPHYEGPEVVCVHVQYTPPGGGEPCDTTLCIQVVCEGDCPDVQLATCDDANVAAQYPQYCSGSSDFCNEGGYIFVLDGAGNLITDYTVEWLYTWPQTNANPYYVEDPGYCVSYSVRVWEVNGCDTTLSFESDCCPDEAPTVNCGDDGSLLGKYIWWDEICGMAYYEVEVICIGEGSYYSITPVYQPNQSGFYSFTLPPFTLQCSSYAIRVRGICSSTGEPGPSSNCILYDRLQGCTTLEGSCDYYFPDGWLTGGGKQSKVGSGNTKLLGDFSGNSVELFPNPANGGEVSLHLGKKIQAGNERVFLRVVNVNGQVIKQEDLNTESSSHQLSIQGFSDGIYLFSVYSLQGELLGSERLVISSDKD